MAARSRRSRPTPDSNDDDTAKRENKMMRLKVEELERLNLQLNQDLGEAKEAARVARTDAYNQGKQAELLERLNSQLNQDLGKAKEAARVASRDANDSRMDANDARTDAYNQEKRAEDHLATVRVLTTTCNRLGRERECLEKDVARKDRRRQRVEMERDIFVEASVNSEAANPDPKRRICDTCEGVATCAACPHCHNCTLCTSCYERTLIADGGWCWNMTCTKCGGFYHLHLAEVHSEYLWDENDRT